MAFAKTSLNTLDILVIIKNLKISLIDSFVTKVYDTELGLIFKLKKGDELRYLLIDPKGWIFFTDYLPVQGKISNFLKVLREKIEGEKITSIDAPYFDRYIEIEFSKKTKLHVEFMRGGNLILSEEGKIIAAYRPLLKGSRIIRANINYSLPEINEFDPFKNDFEKIEEKLMNSKGNIVASFWKIAGIPIEIAEEACYILNIKKDLKPAELGIDKLKEIYKLIKEKCAEYISSERPCIILDEKGYFDYILNMELSIFSSSKKIIMNNFNETIQNYYFKYKEYQSSKYIEELKEKEKEKIKNILDELEKNLNALNNEITILNDLIINLKNNFEKFNQFIEKLKNHIINKEWEKIDYLKQYWPKEFGIIQNINLKNKTITINYKNVSIEFDIMISLMKNIENIYNKIKENKNKINKITLKINELKNKQPVVKEIRKLILKEIPKKKWYENYNWFFTSNGFLAVAGRDSSQNESLLKKRTEKNDLVFHADIHGSPFLIIKTEGKQVSEQDILEAAQFVASYSSAWKAGLSAVDVYWVYPEQISKKAPSGMYLPKGSFMIYGKKNYIKNVPLELAIVFDEKPKIYPSVYKTNKLKIFISPGYFDKEELYNKIINFLKNKNIKIFEKDLKELISNYLPKGKYQILIK